MIVLATGFETHGFVAPMEIAGAAAARSPRRGAECRAPTSASRVPGFPNMFLLYGPNTNGGTGSVIYTIEAGDGATCSRRSRRSSARPARRIEVRREAADAFDRELRAALAETVWHTGCTNWYVDENGNDPNQWPWLWRTYRRRTARLEPGAYELAGLAAGHRGRTSNCLH